MINSLQISPYSVVIYTLIPFCPIHSTSVQYWEISFSTLKPLWDYHHRLLDCDGVSPGEVFAKEPLLRRFPTPQTPSRTLLISTCLPQNCHVGTFHFHDLFSKMKRFQDSNISRHFNTSLLFFSGSQLSGWQTIKCNYICMDGFASRYPPQFIIIHFCRGI